MVDEAPDLEGSNRAGRSKRSGVWPAVFEAAQAQLARNRQRKWDSLRGPRRLLQVTACRHCGYAYYFAFPGWRVDLWCACAEFST
jgi:hypothetical protein